MYYCYGEKCDKGVFNKWQPRMIAVDTMRRYLYYSASVQPSDYAEMCAPVAKAYTTSGRRGSLGSFSSPQGFASPGSPQGAPSFTSTGSPQGTSSSVAECDTPHRPPRNVSDRTSPNSPELPGSANFLNVADTRRPVIDPSRLSSSLDLASPSPSSPRTLNRRPLLHVRTTSTATQLASPSGPDFEEEMKDVCSPKMSRLRWRAKVKIEGIYPYARRNSVQAIDKDALRVDIRCSARPIAIGESPAPGPLLCDEAGLTGGEERCVPGNRDFIRDRYLQLELYRSLTEQFSMLRLRRETAKAMNRHTQSYGTEEGTITSPRPANVPKRSVEFDSFDPPSDPLMDITLRFRSQYAYHRFIFVVSTILGYDRIMVRPYCGFPPYDPRNQIALSPVPVSCWNFFHRLETDMVYILLHGSLYGTQGNVQPPIARATGGGEGGGRAFSAGCIKTVDNVYLCLTYDTIMVLKTNGAMPAWMRWEFVEKFRYLRRGPTPFVAFLTSDESHPDVIFAPKDVGGKLSAFHAATEVDRVLHITHDCCFRSLEARRVIDIAETQYPSAEVFIRGMWDENRHLNIDITATRERCTRSAELFSSPWREVHRLSAEIGAEGDAAIPLDVAGLNLPSGSIPLSQECVDEINQHMQRVVRRNSKEIVSVTETEFRNILENSRHHLFPQDSPRGSPFLPPVAGAPSSPRFNSHHADPMAMESAPPLPARSNESPPPSISRDAIDDDVPMLRVSSQTPRQLSLDGGSHRRSGDEERGMGPQDSGALTETLSAASSRGIFLQLPHGSTNAFNTVVGTSLDSASSELELHPTDVYGSGTTYLPADPTSPLVDRHEVIKLGASSCKEEEEEVVVKEEE